MSAFRSLCIAIVLFLPAGCDKLASKAGPGEPVSFGYVRPVSCERRGPISYNCVMRNHLNGLREVNMECAGFDAEGRMVGRSKSVHALTHVTMQPHGERVATFFYEKGACPAPASPNDRCSRPLASDGGRNCMLFQVVQVKKHLAKTLATHL